MLATLRKLISPSAAGAGSAKTPVPADLHPGLSHDRIQVLMRVSRIFRQHTRDADLTLNDRDLILRVLNRWLAQQAGVLVDVNE